MNGDETTTVVIAAAERLVADLQGTVGQDTVDAALERCLASLKTTNRWGRDNQGPSHDLWRAAQQELRVFACHLQRELQPFGRRHLAVGFERFGMQNDHSSPGKVQAGFCRRFDSAATRSSSIS